MVIEILKSSDFKICVIVIQLHSVLSDHDASVIELM